MKNILQKLSNPITVIFTALVLSIPAFVNSIMVDAEWFDDLSWWGLISSMAIPLAIVWMLFLFIKGLFKRK